LEQLLIASAIKPSQLARVIILGVLFMAVIWPPVRPVLSLSLS
jgi:hypothetical protein